jgi:hypothetical protein
VRSERRLARDLVRDIFLGLGKIVRKHLISPECFPRQVGGVATGPCATNGSCSWTPVAVGGSLDVPWASDS